MSKEVFLLLNLAIAFYNTGTIWAHEVDIFRSWKLLDPITFRLVQETHWRKIPYWIFIPVGLSFAGSIALFWYHPVPVAYRDIWIAFLLQFLSHILTAVCWGPWQAKLAKDSMGAESIYLRKILSTHWIRTLLISGYAGMILFMSIKMLP